MRHIGQLPDEAQARVFGDFLVGCGVPNTVEREDNGAWSLWITDEDHVPTAQTWLTRFRADPKAAEFHQAATEAAKIRKAETEAAAAFRKRVHTRRSLFPKFGGYGVGVLTYALIAISGFVTLATGFGREGTLTWKLFINDPASSVFLEQVRQGQIWRLWTPIFLHFTVPHVVFNLLWLYNLGGMIESRRSTWHLALLVAVIGLVSNLAQYLAQYLVNGYPGFGGMSGVVYGLVGYVWMRGKYDRHCGLALDRTNLTISILWFFACWAGWVGQVANVAHAAGLVLGMAWGRLAAYQAARTP